MIRALLFGLLVVACTHAPPPPPPPVPLKDAGPDASVYVLACDRMGAIGCREGTMANCAEVLEHAAESRLTTLRPDCLAVAQSKADVRNCGGVTCP